ncbi:organic cation transporter protein [Manduca sexta]|uniref:organic cation transporter protein n=1 Tax=Manduca sexta TaxID=7130 RepID=UPI00188E95F6|nr:organic cation transporter protein [Manduca sexta]
MSKYGTDESSYREPYSTFDKVNTDDVTSKIIGDFGRWQFWISFIMTLLKLPIAWYQLNIIFLAPPQNFWCAKPAIFAKYSEEEWRKICSPNIEEHPCLIYDPDLLYVSTAMDRSLIPLVACPMFVFNKTTFSRTITSDWDLVCSKHWLTHLTQCVMMWGIVIGGIIFGVLADKYGRRTPLMISVLIQGVASYVASFMPDYWSFLAVWFILALGSGGVGIISFVICMEVVSGKYRTTVPVLYQLPFGLGNAIMAGLAYWLRDWRKLEFTLATLSSLFIFYWFWIPESPRWLLATGQIEKAMVALKEAAQQNGKCYTMRQLKQLMPKVKSQKRREPGFLSFFRSRNMRLKTFLLSINWFFTGLAFYTFSQYLGSIGGDIFVAVSWTGIISTLGAITCVFIVTKMGRKTTVGIYQLITAICFIMLLVVPKDLFANNWPRLLFAGIGFAGMAGSIPALYLFSGELFPTLGRNVGISGVTTFARIASMIAPAVVSLDNVIITDFPLILLAFTSFAQILLLLPLPETKDMPIPDTLEQAELF